jgi:hypothetical protein
MAEGEEDNPYDAESRKIQKGKARIERADILADYIKRYGRSSLKWRGYPEGSLVIQMKLSSQDSRIIYFDYPEIISEILEEFRVNHPRNLEGKIAHYLTQSDRIAGFKAPLRKGYFTVRSPPERDSC